MARPLQRQIVVRGYAEGGAPKGNLLKLKRREAIEMRLRGTESYSALVGMLDDLIA